MSCDGWSVGDRCRAMQNISVSQMVAGGGTQTTVINAGDEGEVKNKNAKVHSLAVFWQRLSRQITLNHEQIHQIEKI